ncbi:MAG: class I SAM-dependent methyltransferase [Myxococcaceae bacterium]|nr:class I SAM-dependent methyltransferase [Myxococcaceae bacterium]
MSDIDATRMYQPLTDEEDKARTNVHYLLPARFFEVLTGGAWHTYSANVWQAFERADPADPQQQTAAQAAKLDRFAQLLELKPGARVLDVGAGWGGPLIYLCTRYGVKGHGLMLSEEQLRYARAWAERAGADCTFEVKHWNQFEAAPGSFDAVMTDEVIVHFFRLGDFFGKAFGWLRDEGLMVNKELHFVHPALGHTLLPAVQRVNALYGGTANYRSLGDELKLANDAGFAVEQVVELPPRDYHLSAEAWRRNLRAHEAELTALVGAERYREYVLYVSMVSLTHAEGVKHRQQVLHFVQCRKWSAAARKPWSFGPGL